MKKLLSILFLMLVFIIPTFAADEVASTSVVSFLSDNYIAILFAFLAFVEVIVRLTPTKKDDSILSFIMNIINAIFPNKSSDGGTH